MTKFEHIINENKGIEKSNSIFEKAKKPVKVTRDGKTFIQMREEKKTDEQYESIKAEKLEEDADNVLSKLEEENWNGTDSHAKQIIDNTVDSVYNLRLYNDYIADKGKYKIKKLDYQEDTEENTAFPDDYKSPKEEIQELKDKVIKYDGEAADLRMGVKILLNNLESESERWKEQYMSSVTTGFPDKVAGGKYSATLRAIELINDGLKHLL